MIKKLLTIVFGVFFTFCAQAAQMANVEYIHNLIANRVGVEVPYNPKLRSPKQVANMEYLLTAVDVVNEILNGTVTTNFAGGEYASNQVVDVDIINTAVNELVQEEWPFAVTTTKDTSSFGFVLGAAGTFLVDWGDGTVETIVRENSKFIQYNHSYATPGEYTVRLGGKATAYEYLEVDHIINTLQTVIMGDIEEAESALANLVIPSEGITITFVTDSDRIAHIEGSLGEIFPTLPNGDNPQFLLTFAGAMNWDGVVPERLFSRIHGQPSPLMFTGTFALSNLKGIPDKIFSGLYGNPSYGMNVGTFLLTPYVESSIPSKLYANLRGAPERGAFLGTFALSGFKGEIPSGIFAGLKGQAKEAAFALTFAGMPYVEGRIPAKLFAGISGRPMAAQYLGTFAGSGIDLLALIEGGDLSIDVIKGNGLTGAIPEALFANLNGAPGELAFAGTFGASFGLSGSIPEDLFAGVKGAPAPGVFLGTFAACTQLSGEIPGGLFRNIKGKPALGMFGFTFIEDDRLSGIGDGLFAGISGAAELGMFFMTFYSISDLQGPSAKIDGKYLYDIWPDEFMLTYAAADKLDDYNVIPENWGGLGAVGVGEPQFVLTTTPGTTSFSFNINAAGNFAVDWGDGEVESIMHMETTQFSFSHKYAKAGEYKIKVSGKALAYYSGSNVATVSFEGNQNLAKFEGSFRDMFPVLPLIVGKLVDAPNFHRTFADCKNLKGSIPEDLFPEGIYTESLTSGVNSVFYQTFMGCSGLTGSIPAKLFAGVSGRPVEYLFSETFAGCSGLTGSIPAGLFSGIKGAPAYAMFSGTFDGCSGLTGSIPADLFSGIVGSPATDMFLKTFAGCSGLTGSIPGGLFGGINGYPASYMFEQTFAGCSGLTGEIPADLFIGVTTGSSATDMFYGTFRGCSGLIGASAQNNGQYLYNIWEPEYMNTMYCDVDNLTDIEMMPEAVKSCGGFSDVDWSDWDFEFETNNTSSVSFSVAAAGTFYVDWGDGNKEEVVRTSTAASSISHSYRRSGRYTVKLGGVATAYNTSDTQATISFSNSSVLASIDGSLGAVFPTLADGSQPSFYRSFYNLYSMRGQLPAELFAGIKGAPRPYMFYGTFDGCTGLTGVIPGDLFAGIKGAPAPYMFSGTFSNCYGLSGIGGPLFAGISGTPATDMFFQTFNGCTGLTGEIPANFIGTLSGNAATNMFGYMFRNCANLTGNSVKAGGEYLYNIWPDATFAQIGGLYEGAVNLAGMRCGSEDQVPLSWGGPVCLDYWPLEITTADVSSYGMYISASGTFYVDWGDGYTQIIDKTNTSNTYYSHSYNKSGVYTVKLAGLATAYNSSNTTSVIQFGTYTEGIKGSLGEIFPTLANGTQPSFYRAFYNCSSYLKGEIPATLFKGISGAPRAYMFYQTFYDCSGLTGSIPADLFAGIQGAPATYMFYQTFYNCSGLTGIGGPLFAGIQGAPATYMFYQTFYNCSGLKGEIPTGMFGALSGTPASYMFNQTFFGCFGLTGEIPANLFGSISGTATGNMFTQTFQGCSGLTGPSAKIGDQYLYEIWPNATAAQVGDMYTGCTGLTDNSCETGVSIPAIWGAAACVDDWKFEYTTTNTTDTTVSLSAMGTFYVDWGDGSSSVIERTDTSLKSYKHVYVKSAAYTVKVAGLATAYNTNDKTATVKFTRVASVSGQLGALFPTLADGTQPSFYQTFADASLKTIPADLFAGVSGAPRPYMFYQTFEGCTALTEVPEGLFANIAGAPVAHLFNGIFYGCTSLKTVPENLFAGIQGAPADSMFYQAFYNCYNLTELPENLFATIKGAPAASMFKQAFYNCDGLTTLPEGLFAGIQGAPASSMFEAAFDSCSGLTTLPAGLFAGIKGAPASSMFKQTFQYCSNLTTLPEGLFAGIQGAPVTYMFQYAFANTGLTAVPEDLFAGIKGAPANYMFQYVLQGSTKLTTIPAGLFAGIEGAPATSMFGYAFQNTGITSIPENLFAGIQGAPAANMFQYTFGDCRKLTTIPAGLFAGIQGKPAKYMFAGTFSDCDGLTTIPASLFAGISGAPASYMFDSTFNDCDGLTTIPSGLFAGISGKPATYMFRYTFYSCDKLSAIPEDLFGNISGSAASNMFYYTFAYCPALRGPSAKIDGKYLYEIWPSSSQYTYYSSTGLTDYSSIPSYWK